jgi:hypothetical protein
MTARDTPFGRHSRTRRLRQATIDKAARGYGRWLGFLWSAGRLDIDAVPSARVTPANLNAFFWGMVQLGNADHTIVGRIGELVCALRIMEPYGNQGWILRPGGVALRQHLPMVRRSLEIHHLADLFLWGIDLMDEARALAELQRRGPMLRDGLMIAMLALRGLRLRSVESLVLGRSILPDPETGCWRLDIQPEEVKNHRHIATELPRILSPWIERYVTVERAEMLSGQATDAFWIGQRGAPLSASGVTNAIARRSEARFGAASRAARADRGR